MWFYPAAAHIFLIVFIRRISIIGVTYIVKVDRIAFKCVFLANGVVVPYASVNADDRLPIIVWPHLPIINVVVMNVVS